MTNKMEKLNGKIYWNNSVHKLGELVGLKLGVQFGDKIGCIV